MRNTGLINPRSEKGLANMLRRTCVALGVVLCVLATLLPTAAPAAQPAAGVPPSLSASPSPQTSPAAFLYQPEPSVLADVIPFYWKGTFHLLYLQTKPGQKGFDWAQIVTPDFVSYQYTGVAIPSGGTDDALDLNIFTGSVIEKDGVLYAFYTGHNQSLGKQGKPDQLILRAVSRDGIRWTKEPQFRFSPQGNANYRYPGGCRDPFMFWNPERDQYGMVFCATPAKFPIGGLGYAGSDDLEHWRLDEPLAASGRFPGYECPDLFRLGDRWYLLFSTYDHNPGWATRYMTARRLQGPWESPGDDFFDGGSLYAAKSAGDGKRRFLCGTLPSRKDKRDDGDNGWGGRLLIYEMVGMGGDRLGVRIPAEVEDSFGKPEPIKVAGNPTWWEPRKAGLRSVVGQARAYVGKLPGRCLLSVELTVPSTGRAGLWLGGDAKNEQAFRLFVDVAMQRVVWDRGSLPLGSNPERERPYRPLKIQPGDRITLRVALDGDAAVACVNDTTCLATRIYDRRDNTCGIWSDTVGAEFENVLLRSH
jgi:beta-fructofuranosidase